MGLSRNKVAVPEGAAGSPPFYGEYRTLSGVRCEPRVRDGPGSSGMLVWKQPLMMWYGHAFGFPDRHPRFVPGAVLPFRRASGLVPVGFRAVGAWWFENWIVDASNSQVFSWVLFCMFR